MSGYDIGKKIKSMRKIRGMSLQQLSDITQMSYSYLSGLENNKHSISISNLQRIAKAFEVDMVQFLQENNRITSYSKWEENLVEMSDGIYYGVASKNDSRRIQLTKYDLPPNSPSEKNIHKHKKGEEVIIVLSGEVCVVVESEKYLLEKGDVLHFDSRLEHTIYTEELEAKIYILSSPPYDEDSFDW